MPAEGKAEKPGAGCLATILAYDFHDRAQAVREFEKALAPAPNAPDADRIKQMTQELKTAK